MSDWLIAVLIGMAIGLVVGVKIARDSAKVQPITGGMLSDTFHYLACAGLTGILPFIITGIVLGLPFLTLFGTALGFLALTAMFLLLHASIERNAPPPLEQSHLTE